MLADTDLTFTEIAFAAGFGSVRQFNRSFHEVFRARPSDVRQRRRWGDQIAADGSLVVRLAFRPPLDWLGMIGYFQARAIPGVESVDDAAYRRTILVDGDPGALELRPGGSDDLLLRLHLTHWESLIDLVLQSRHIFNLDCDVESATNHLQSDAVLRRAVDMTSGIRAPGTWDPFEAGVAAIMGERLTAPPSNSPLSLLVERYGVPVPGLNALGLSHLFPTAASLAGADLSQLGLDGATALTLRSFAHACATHSIQLDRASTLATLVTALTALPGLSPGAAHYIALRMGERDASLWDEPGVQAPLEAVIGSTLTRHQLGDIMENWRPWRAQAAALIALAGLH
jgi:AraC family transcriptional regulator of adaptative response / DNA-3-methyladenine glycosylase II